MEETKILKPTLEIQKLNGQKLDVIFDVITEWDKRIHGSHALQKSLINQIF